MIAGPNHERFLDTLIDDLTVSSSFKVTSKNLGFRTIREMTDKGWGALLKMDGFCYDCFNELVTLLQNRGMLGMLERN